MPRASGAMAGHSDSVARWMGAVAAGALLVALALVFRSKLAEFRDPFATWSEDVSLLLGTAWGNTWMAAVVVAVVALFGTVMAASSERAVWVAERGVRRAWAWWIVAGAAVVLCFFPALTGHAQAVPERWRWLAVAADGLHVMGAGLWVGGLAFLLVSEGAWQRARARGGEGQGGVDVSGPLRSVLPELVPLFSPLALVGAATVIGTGTLSAFLHVESLAALIETAYGRVLIAKLALVGGVVTLGAINWRRLTPRMVTADGVRSLNRSAWWELVLMHTVIIVTAVLVRTDPLVPWAWNNLGR